MKAVVLERKGLVDIREVPDAPDPGPGELRIAPNTVGICGSDVHYYTHGRIGQFIVTAPMILGHECAGTITEVGPDVTGFKPGDRVAMEPGIPDMYSRASREGMYNVDPSLKFFATPPVDGCLCERVVHPAAFTYVLPDSVSFGEGALLEPLAVGMHSASQADIKPGDVAAVAGSGTIGILTAASALAAGASRVYVSDVSDARLHIAAGIPGVIPVDLKKDDLVERVKDETDGWGADRVFEASGSEQSYDTIFEVGAPGNTTVLIGMTVGKVPLDVVAAQAHEATIKTIFRYRNVYQKAIDLIAAGRLDLKPFITDSYPMEDSVAAFERVREVRPADVKIQILVDHD